MTGAKPSGEGTAGLVESYRRIKQSIVAFVAKNTPEVVGSDGRPGLRHIIGTGFVLRADGVIVTNEHVVRLFPQLPRSNSQENWPVEALLLWQEDIGVVQLQLPVIGVGIPKTETPKVFYGAERPDIALVHVKATGLPAIEVDDDFVPVEGMRIATAGFPMGTDALMAGGWLQQMTPTLQEGVVSAVLPFACRHAHGYTINIMVQGGASGSPVFCPETGKVVGLLYAALVEPRGNSIQPTNISYVLSGDNLSKALAVIAGSAEFAPPSDAPSVQKMLENTYLHNPFDDKLYRYADVKKTGGFRSPPTGS